MTTSRIPTETAAATAETPTKSAAAPATNYKRCRLHAFYVHSRQPITSLPYSKV
jgi:hypothetical protein